MPNLDADIKWRRKQVFLGVGDIDFVASGHTHNFIVATGIVDAAGTRVNTAVGPPVQIGHVDAANTVLGGSAANGGVQGSSADPWQGASTGAPVASLITGTLVSGLQIDATTDILAFQWEVPNDLDPRQSIGFRVRWTSSTVTAADAPQWRLRYVPLNEDIAIATGAPTALDTLIAADAYGFATALRNKRTERGAIAGNMLAFTGDAVTALTLLLLLNVEVAGGIDFAPELMWFRKLEIDYWPTRCQDGLTLRGPHVYADP